jgi:hypothetical protein
VRPDWYSIISISYQSKVPSWPRRKTRAEVRKKYFYRVKISTQMLIRLWKSTVRAPLTCRPSTLFSSLHN